MQCPLSAVIDSKRETRVGLATDTTKHPLLHRHAAAVVLAADLHRLIHLHSRSTNLAGITKNNTSTYLTKEMIPINCGVAADAKFLAKFDTGVFFAPEIDEENHGLV